MTLVFRDIVVAEILSDLDVPAGAYDAATRRYRDFGDWLKESASARSREFEPHVFPQGSFRIGTVVRPWGREDYDLDLACNLESGFTKKAYSQYQLKSLLGADVEAYRRARGIQHAPEEKHRCWRLSYKDDIQFHMDIVPAIPELDETQQERYGQMVEAGVTEDLARHLSRSIVAITDNRHPHYKVCVPEWPVSNQEGFARWFESRMRQARQVLEARASVEKVATIDEIPVYKWKTPLQHCIQILKRHRDVLFEADPEGKPISVIITTLAAQAYQGEPTVEAALAGVLNRMGGLVRSSTPRVPNPSNPREDFADKWSLNPALEPNFRRWLKRAQEDFGQLADTANVDLLVETARRNFGVAIDAAKVRRAANLLPKAAVVSAGNAATAADGTIGSVGVRNLPHKFYA